MPTYVYRREDGSTFEVEQRITAAPLDVCPDTGQKVERVITGAGLIFKGSGFYLTDYARKSENGSSTDASAAKDSKEGAKDSKEGKDAKEPAKAAKTTEPAESTSTSNEKSSTGSKSTD